MSNFIEMITPSWHTNQTLWSLGERIQSGQYIFESYIQSVNTFDIPFILFLFYSLFLCVFFFPLLFYSYITFSSPTSFSHTNLHFLHPILRKTLFISPFFSLYLLILTKLIFSYHLCVLLLHVICLLFLPLHPDPSILFVPYYFFQFIYSFFFSIFDLPSSYSSLMFWHS